MSIEDILRGAFHLMLLMVFLFPILRVGLRNGLRNGMGIGESKSKLTMSQLRNYYYPDYMNRQQAQREIAADRETYNNETYLSAFWAGADEYVDYDGHLRKIARMASADIYPNITDNGIVKKNVALPRKSGVIRSMITIRK